MRGLRAADANAPRSGSPPHHIAGTKKTTVTVVIAVYPRRREAKGGRHAHGEERPPKATTRVPDPTPLGDVGLHVGGSGVISYQIWGIFLSNIFDRILTVFCVFDEYTVLCCILMYSRVLEGAVVLCIYCAIF